MVVVRALLMFLGGALILGCFPYWAWTVKRFFCGPDVQPLYVVASSVGLALGMSLLGVLLWVS